MPQAWMSKRKNRRTGTNRRVRGEPLEDRTLLATVTVHIFNFDFSANPKGQPILDPTINVGDTIHWVLDEGFHSTTSVVGIAESWDSGAILHGPHSIIHSRI